jgi:hypothetical protein
MDSLRALGWRYFGNYFFRYSASRHNACKGDQRGIEIKNEAVGL